MFQAVPHPLLVYQHSPALIKRNSFLPRALRATDSCASLKNPGEPVFPSWPHHREAGERTGWERRASHVLNSEVREQVEESRKEWSHRGTELRALTQAGSLSGHPVMLLFSLFLHISVTQKPGTKGMGETGHHRP